MTLRVSGFFRDAFPNVMKLYDSAVQALVEFDEPGSMNTIQQNVEQRAQELTQQGLSPVDANRQASYRVFGSKPGKIKTTANMIYSTPMTIINFRGV